MKHRDTIQDELQGLNSSLPGDTNKTPFAVPEGYFEGFAASMMKLVKKETTDSASAEIAELSPLLAGISRQMPFEVPANYFQTNIDVLPAITSDNEDSLVLSFIDKEMPYEVPQGYFFNLPEQVMETVENRETRVVKMSGRKWIRMAVAAMIAGIITVSGIVYFNTDNSSAGRNNNIASQTVKQDVKKELKAVSNEELDAFIKTTVVSENSSATVKNTSKSTDVKTLLQDVSDKELDAFLDQVPTDVEEEIVL